MFEILGYEFFQRALIGGTLVAIVAPIIGLFLVVRRLPALADTLSHVSLLGISIASLFRFSEVYVASLASVTAGIGIEYLRSNKKIYGESVLVLFLSGSLGISAVLLSLSKNAGANLNRVLFGSINSITWNELYLSFIVALITISAFAIFRKKFYLIALDEELAISQGLKVKQLNYLLVILSALVVSVSIQITGVLLTGAIMILPVLTALQYRLSFKSTLIYGIVFALLSIWLGLFLSYFLDLSTGGVIVIVNLLFFIVALITKNLLKN